MGRTLISKLYDPPKEVRRNSRTVLVAVLVPVEDDFRGKISAVTS